MNVIESWNSANGFIFYGKGGEVSTNNTADQEIAILSLHLLQICMVYINTLMLQQILSGQTWRGQLQIDDLRALTPLFYSHVNPYGEFKLKMNQRLQISQPSNPT